MLNPTVKEVLGSARKCEAAEREVAVCLLIYKETPSEESRRTYNKAFYRLVCACAEAWESGQLEFPLEYEWLDRPRGGMPAISVQEKITAEIVVDLRLRHAELQKEYDNLYQEVSSLGYKADPDRWVDAYQKMQDALYLKARIESESFLRYGLHASWWRHAAPML